MKGIQLIFKDWKAMWNHKHGRIALIFLLIVPLIYAGFFLAGYWDPYGRLDKLPVAVVNLDKGAVMDEKAIHAGDDFVKNLKENKELAFHFVSEKNADEGLKEDKYYMVVTIPEDFSKKVSTLMDEKPEPAQLQYKVNPGKNFVAAQIGTTAVENMKTKISNSITKSYTEGVFSKFQDLAQGLNDASNGAGKLHEGTTDAKNGVNELSGGINRLSDGANQLKEGSDKLAASQGALTGGANELSQGATSLHNGMELLTEGEKGLQEGVSNLSAGTNEWISGNEKLAEGQAKADEAANAVQKQLEEYAKNHPEVQQDPAFQQIVATSSGLAKATNTLNASQQQLTQGARKLADGQHKIEEGMNTFGVKLNEATSGTKKVADGAANLADGFTKWGNGFKSLQEGVNHLASGGTELNNGAGKLTDGLIKLDDGAKELSTKLGEGAEKIADVRNDDARNAMFSEPVQLVKSTVSDVPNYGSGIAPYFLSLAFYVGGIMASNILPLGRRQNMKVSGTVHFINKLGLVYLIGLIQAFLVDAVVLGIMKLEVASVPLFVLSSIIISFTFMTFILMLVTVFGIVGKFAAVTLLVLQLATSGGTFPGELNIAVLSKIGQFLPMSHSLRGLQDVISLGDWSQLRMQILILLCYLVVAGGISWITSHIQHKETNAEQVS
ncbi:MULTISPECIES: YhgE/Pip family protein [Bacillus]|uniref:YhgE/Pip family protein n=1 Tax=Bacillus TaxID=1386 RepID=UPI000469E707|nr:MULTISPECIES: YhgE/Pip domain-containing protein [Bacillus]MED1409439.1 YhgE/Pip domain-containing protein [Bacillus paramycoides]MED1463032.1 YhgE/Pip domain-containing protein [Bacillus paramycoides]MED1492650.1 YhgE/Pip domain-containing protein [Bacillus paramycoides]